VRSGGGNKQFVEQNLAQLKEELQELNQKFLNKRAKNQEFLRKVTPPNQFSAMFR
jgi:ABC-type Zn uptake system ZnuABC Zn-binding protein ZnuA